ncbi:MAG: B12-binding domain-containing radical SAM protein [Magnetococcales bacterium]|nr:B12-binding domain-containing radical SAM protein [Magnetococcales bacterium]NGZ06777.1 B12-binding domain-containing radical SAM protein [Magnetococcales bacterium]
MKCVFLCERNSFAVLGVEYLIAILRLHEHEVKVVFDASFTKPWEPLLLKTAQDSSVVHDLISTPCDLVLAYINSTNFKRIVHLFELLKEAMPNVTTCVGGPHASYAHENTLAKPCLDFVCRGEGEIAILELIDFLSKRRTTLPQGIYRRVNGINEGYGFGTLVADLDQLPFPDKSDYYANLPQIRDVYTVISGRGCYNRCTFCNSSTIRNYYREDGFNFMRRRSVRDVIAELRQAKEIYRPKFVWFCDDTFIYNKKWIREFADRYATEVNLPFGCSTIPDFFDEELMAALVRAGLCNVEVGIQTLNPETRFRVFGRRETNEQFLRFVKLLRRHGIYAHCDHILNPWDSRDSLKTQIDAYIDVEPCWINVFHLQYFPNTSVVECAVADGFLTKEQATEVGEGSLDTFFSGGSIQEHFDNQKDLALLLFLSPLLPARLIRWLLASPHLSWVGKISPRITLVIRALNAVLRHADMFGRVHLRNVILSIVRWPQPADPKVVAGLRAMALSKGRLEVRSAPMKMRSGS